MTAFIVTQHLLCLKLDFCLILSKQKEVSGASNVRDCTIVLSLLVSVVSFDLFTVKCFTNCSMPFIYSDPNVDLLFIEFEAFTSELLLKVLHWI